MQAPSRLADDRDSHVLIIIVIITVEDFAILVCNAVMDFPAWAKTVPEVLAHVAVTPESGLTQEEVEKRREKYGYNELEKQASTPLWKLVLSQFDDMLVKVETALTAESKCAEMSLGAVNGCCCLFCAGLL